jgi:hypothetical protein
VDWPRAGVSGIKLLQPINLFLICLVEGLKGFILILELAILILELVEILLQCIDVVPVASTRDSLGYAISVPLVF